jgi:hypothetical protein
MTKRVRKSKIGPRRGVVVIAMLALALLVRREEKLAAG